MQQDEKKVGIIIPMAKLSDVALSTLIEEFILREGTEYGNVERSLEEKKQSILKQLQTNRIVIMFDPQIENTTLITKDQLQKLSQQNFEIVTAP